MQQLVIKSHEPLSHEVITERLLALRSNALIEISHFAVSAVVEIELPGGEYAYVGGVNVENDEHQGLTLHAEQNAITLANALYGGAVKFSRLWVMGAPENVTKGSQDPMADNPVTPCGHCRQILMSNSKQDAKIYFVTVNGRVEEALLSDLLPKAFSERDLGSTAAASSSTVVTEGESQSSGSGSASPAETGLFAQPRRDVRMELGQLLEKTGELSDGMIQMYIRSIKPHVITSFNKTSSIESCIIQACSSKGGPSHYVVGALMQDVAFQTTDAVHAAIGAGITGFGGKELVFEAVHIYGKLKDGQPPILAGNELAELSRFANLQTPIVFHSPDRQIKKSTLDQCMQAQAEHQALKAHHHAPQQHHHHDHTGGVSL